MERINGFQELVRMIFVQRCPNDFKGRQYPLNVCGVFMPFHLLPLSSPPFDRRNSTMSSENSTSAISVDVTNATALLSFIGKARSTAGKSASGERKAIILSIDGGGMRGLIAATILERLEELIKEKSGVSEVKLSDYFDLISGTSTGSILTAMLTIPDESGKQKYDSAVATQLYVENGKEIFKKPWYYFMNGQLANLFGPKYTGESLDKILKTYIGETLTVKDMLIPSLITAFDIGSAEPLVFTRHESLQNDSENYLLWNACRASSAAPTYFPPTEFSSVDGKNKVTCIDGGTIQNNPGLLSLAHVLSNMEYFKINSVDDVMLLSLGTGHTETSYDLSTAKHWGILKWITPLMSIMMDGTADVVDQQVGASFALRGRSSSYLRIQTHNLPKELQAMDDASNPQGYIDFAKELLKTKAVKYNKHGEEVTVDKTYEEWLGDFATELIRQKELKDQDKLSETVEPETVPTVAASAIRRSPRVGFSRVRTKLYLRSACLPVFPDLHLRVSSAPVLGSAPLGLRSLMKVPSPVCFV